jgi:hypothetical protein
MQRAQKTLQRASLGLCCIFFFFHKRTIVTIFGWNLAPNCFEDPFLTFGIRVPTIINEQLTFSEGIVSRIGGY